MGDAVGKLPRIDHENEEQAHASAGGLSAKGRKKKVLARSATNSFSISYCELPNVLRLRPINACIGDRCLMLWSRLECVHDGTNGYYHVARPS